MSNTRVGILGFAAAVLLALAGGAALAPKAASNDDRIPPVFVTNFPETQRVEGTLKISEPVPLAALSTLSDLEVAPRLVPISVRMTPAGTVVTDGFGAVVLSLRVNQVGHLLRSGEVGAILVPDEEPVLDAFTERGIAQFTLEVRATCGPGGPLCASIPTRQVVGFPRYKVFLFNTTERPVTVDLYAYLTH